MTHSRTTSSGGAPGDIWHWWRVHPNQRTRSHCIFMLCNAAAIGHLAGRLCVCVCVRDDYADDDDILCLVRSGDYPSCLMVNIYTHD